MKKLAIWGLVIFGCFFLLRKTNVCSYVSTAWSKVRATAKNQVPIEFEIDRVRHEIAKLDDDVRNQVGPIAEEMANVETMRKRVSETRASLQREKGNILAMTRELDSGAKLIVLGEDEYSAEEVRAKLDRDFGAYRRCKAELESQEQLLAAKEKSLRTVREQIASMRNLKRDLEVQLAQLEAELKTVRLAQTRDKYQLDDSRLSDIKASLAEIEHRLTVERKVSELNGQIASPAAPAHKRLKSTTDLTREVKNYFGERAPKEGKVAVSRK
jgi:peptidoglycan hydrolase CwlO-like protein